MSNNPTAESAKEYLKQRCSPFDKTFEPDGDNLYLEINVINMMESFAQSQCQSEYQRGFDEGYEQATSEATKEIQENYVPIEDYRNDIRD